MITNDKCLGDLDTLSSLLACSVCGLISSDTSICLSCGRLLCKKCLTGDSFRLGSCCDRFNIKESYLLIDIIGSFADFKNSVKKSHDGNILPTNYSLHNSEITRSSNDNKKQYRDSPPLPAPNDKVSNETPTTGRRTPRTQSHPDTSTHKPITPLLSPTQLLNHTFESTDDYYTGAPNQQNFELKLTPIDSSQLDMLHHSSHSDGMLSSSSGAPMTAFEDSYGALINQIAKKARRVEAALQNDEIAHKLTHEELQNDDLDSQQTTDSLPMDSNAPPVIKQEFHVSAIHQNSGSSSSAQTIPASLSIAKTLPSILPLPPTVSIEYSDLCETSRRYLCECQAKGWIDIYSNFESTGPMRYRALVMDSVTVVREGVTLRLVKRTLKYVMALCEGIRVLDSSWLCDSLVPTAQHLVNPTAYEVDGTVRDYTHKMSYQARICPRDSEGRSQLLAAYEFTLLRSGDSSFIDLGKNSANKRKTVDPNPVSNSTLNSSSSTTSCNVISEADVCWMIYKCGGIVRTVIDESDFNLSGNSTSQINWSEKEHLILGLRRPLRDRQKLSVEGRIPTSRVLSFSWLLDAICNQCPRSVENCPRHFFL